MVHKVNENIKYSWWYGHDERMPVTEASEASMARLKVKVKILG